MLKNFLKSKLIFLFLISASVYLSCQDKKSIHIPFSDNHIRYEGRIFADSSSAHLYWPGTQIEIYFKGSSIGGVFYDNTGKNYYNLILNNDSIKIFRPDTIKKEYQLFDGLPDTIHNLKIYKRTEWNRGTTQFYGFVPGKGSKLIGRPPAKKRKIEYYGNSITAGFGVEDYSGQDRSDSVFTNNYLTYAALAARHFNAEANYIVRSGIGVMVSWFPLIMPEMYNRLNPNEPESNWDFSKYKPDLVVINLLQNDAYLFNSPKSKEYLYRFENNPKPNEEYIIQSYATFVKSIREKHPQAAIICMLGNLSITKEGSPWPGYVTKAVQRLNDPQIYTLFVPFKKTGGHPRIEEQKKMGESLIRFVHKKLKWE
jgi:hypothetical protein